MKETLAYAIANADGWVVQNLRRKHNSVFPSNLIAEESDIILWEKVLTCIIGEPVSIRKTDGGFICEV